MTNAVLLSDRDRSLLKFLSWTPATTALLLRASRTFDGGSFLDERRLRERVQSLSATGLVRSWAATSPGGGLQNYYKLTPSGFQALHGPEVELPSRTFFAEISPALFEHTLRLAEVVVETACACHTHRVTIDRFCRENELTLTVGDESVQPDGFFRFMVGGRNFHVALEIDLSNEPVDSPSFRSIRRKILTYDAYQTSVLTQWRENGKTWERPRFRVAFLTKSIERAYHILAVADEVALNKSRRLVYATTLENYLAEPDSVRAPIFLDHGGRWQALVDLHPTSRSTREPVRIPRAIERGWPL